MKVRLKDVAKQLNISVSTVSRALSNHPRISDVTKKRVAALVKKLNYRPNLIAKSLKLNITKTIGFIIPDITNPFCPELVKGAEYIANKNDLDIILCNSDFNIKKEFRQLMNLEQKRVDGVLILPTSRNSSSIKYLTNNNIPFVILDAKPESRSKGNYVYADHTHGAYIATKYLIELGHTKIGLINGPKTHSPCKQLENGFLKALNEFKINVIYDYLKECDFNIIGGNKAMREILSLRKHKLPTAILFISDITAIGGYEAIYKEGFKIPNDFSIIGYDDIPESKFLSPPLTTVSQLKQNLGTIGMNLLINKLKSNKKSSSKHIKLIPTLKIRKSTSPLS